jgi:hypothetical protein
VPLDLQASAAAVDALLSHYRPWQIVLLAAGATLLLVTAAQVRSRLLRQLATAGNSSRCRKQNVSMPWRACKR